MISLPQNINSAVIPYFQNSKPEDGLNSLAIQRPDLLIEFFKSALTDLEWSNTYPTLIDRLIKQIKEHHSTLDQSQLNIIVKKALFSSVNSDLIQKPYNQKTPCADATKLIQELRQTGTIQRQTFAEVGSLLAEKRPNPAFIVALKELRMPDLAVNLLPYDTEEVFSFLYLAYQQQHQELLTACLKTINAKIDEIQLVANGWDNITIVLKNTKTSKNYRDLLVFLNAIAPKVKLTLKIDQEFPFTKQLGMAILEKNLPFSAINLSDCSCVTDLDISLLAAAKTELQEIYLSGCSRISGDAIKALNDQCPELTILDLSNCAALKQIPELKNPFVQLVSLKLANASQRLDNTSIATLIKACCPAMKSVDLSGSQVGNDTIDLLAQLNPGLEEVNLLKCSLIESQSLISLNKYCHKHLRSLTLDVGTDYKINQEIFVKFGKFSQLTSLHLRCKPELSATLLSNALKACTQLTKFKLNRCKQLTDEHVQLLVKGNPLLQEVDLSESTFTGNSVRLLNENCLGLRSLSLNWNFAPNFVIPELSKKFEHLQFLKLKGQYTEIVSHYLPLLAASPNLLLLNLRQCSGITPEVITTTAANCPHIEKINLGEFSITSQGLKKLNEKCKSLRSLSFSFRSSESLETPFECLTSLEMIDSDATPQDFENFVHACPNLTSISIKNFRHITDAAIETLVKRCGNLQKITITQCPLITAESLKHLNGHSLQLKHLELIECKKIHSLESFSENFKELTSLALDLPSQEAVKFIQASPKLSTLSLQSLNIDEDVINVLVNNSRSLHTLSLWPAINICAIDTFVAGMKVLTQNSPQLSTLVIPLPSSTSDNHLLNMTPAFKGLEQLVLMETTNLSLDAIIKLLEQCEKLQYLEMRGKNFSLDEIKKIRGTFPFVELKIRV